MTLKNLIFIYTFSFFSYFGAFVANAKTPENESTEMPSGLEVIQIRGFHDSAIKSIQEKRNSDFILDVITAQDIGKFPDKNVAEALQRITGISLSRVQGEGERVGVRGTTPEQNRTFLNGQSLASADWWISTQPNRGFNYTLLPADLVSSLEVYKTPQADHDEGSLGGAVNIKTQRPLHTKSNQFIINAQTQYNDLSGEFDPQFAAFYNWQNNEKDLGVLITLTRNQRSLRRDGLESWGWHEQSFYQNDDDLLTPTNNDDADLKKIWTPGGGGSAVFKQQRVLTSTTASVEYQPHFDWNIQLNALYSVLDADSSNQNFLWQPNSVLARGGYISDAEIIDNTLAFAHYSKVPEKNNQNFSSNTAMEAIWRNSTIDTSSLHLIASQQAHLWKNQYQIGFTTGGGGSKHDYTSQFSANTAFSVDTRIHQNIIADYSVSPLDAPAWKLTKARNDSQKSNDQEFYLQGDFERAIDHSIISAIKVGTKFRNHQRDFIRFRSFNNAVDGLDWTLADYPADFVNNYLSNIGDKHTLKNYSYVDINALSKDFQNINFIQQEEKASRFDIQERTLAGYVKLMLNGEDYRANLGVRLINTAQTASAYKRIGSPLDEQENFSWQQHDKNYIDILPSINLAIDLNDNLIARFSAARVMSRPQYNHLMPSTNYNITQAQGQGGNPQLDPYRANQFDISLEWYFDDAALFSVALFNKDVESFVEFKRSIERHEGIDMTIDRPINGSGGTTRGVELSFQQEFFYGFGLISNYTFVDGKRTDSQLSQHNYIPGTSKHTMNMTAYYENNLFSSRLAYNYRTKFATGVGEAIMDNFGQLDGNITFKVTDNFDLIIEAINLTNEITYIYERNEYAPTGIYQNGRRFYFGVRYSH